MANKRPNKDEYYLQMAEVVAKRSTCARRQVGCVLVDKKGLVISTGYNGVPFNIPHCRDSKENRCPAADAKSGTNLEGCGAVHAEMNALIQCRDPYDIHTCYVTASPCLTTCINALLNTSCKRIVYREKYAHSKALDKWNSIHDHYSIHLPSETDKEV